MRLQGETRLAGNKESIKKSYRRYCFIVTHMKKFKTQLKEVALYDWTPLPLETVEY